MTREQLNALLGQKAIAHQMTGSRYICDPAPKDTDEDYIAFMSCGNEQCLELAGFDMNTDPTLYEEMPDFLAYRLGEFNVIVTHNIEFYRLFVQATEEAKALNLLSKSDRIKLFQKVLYGNDMDEIPL